MSITFVISAVQVPASFAAHKATDASEQWLQFVHYVGEVITYTLVFAVVISLIYRATARTGPRRVMRLVLVAGGLAFILTSFFIHYDSKAPLPMWITPWTRDMNFCAAVLDMALWALLLASREKDTRLLLLSGGMGIMFGGEAIADSIRHLAIRNHSRNTFMLGNVLVTLADCAFLYVWWQTFRKEAIMREAEAAKARQAVCNGG